jgi:hypothetical protein
MLLIQQGENNPERAAERAYAFAEAMLRKRYEYYLSDSKRITEMRDQPPRRTYRPPLAPRSPMPTVPLAAPLTPVASQAAPAAPVQ